MRLGYRGLLALATIAALSLLAPSALVAQQQSKAEQALTCAGVFFAVADDPRDPAVVAILQRYRSLTGVDAAEAERAGSETGTAMVQLVADGKLSGAKLVEAAEACSRIFQVAVPHYNRRIVSAGAAPQVAAAPRVTTPPPDTAECDRADRAFTDEMTRQAGKLEEAGPRETDDCDDNGLQCGVRRPRSQFYYALGKACDALKASQQNARRACAAYPAIVRELTIPAELNC